MCIEKKIKKIEEIHYMKLQKKNQKYLMNKKMKFIEVIDKKINKLSREDKQNWFRCMNDLAKIMGKVR